ncbi:histidine--tRNA ligase [Kaustia mangrovi]|uniref:Histidine--tRNA ligase n=1 Tax=Kaustia mangrovi TaxID=2593653 RepID=A0A7S8C103_9HYPH|nr:histidine--tRNA ligase [Kaustia mangrovi]QPC41378.1 histidine--tRNA ligase [Kaustia mangrovi]
MSKKTKIRRPKARLAKGFRDIEAGELRGMKRMLATIEHVYESYGFEPIETPAIEYTEALGKFLPDQDRPNEGVFSFQDEDEQWLSLRYDLTAPLARYVAENYDALPKPYRSYRAGWVFRNEKPGPGRFRQFMQFDADTVGTASPAADAEVCMMAADTLEALGIPRGAYVIRVNNRKVLDGVLETIGLDPADPTFEMQRLTILRAIDKLDRLGTEGVRLLLGAGRKDDSGDFTKGAGLGAAQIDTVMAFVEAGGANRTDVLKALEPLVAGSAQGVEGLAELAEMDTLFSAAGYDPDRICLDPSVVRGLGYYTGPVFEAELTFEAETEEGEIARFGSVGGGGRYDDLVARFRGQDVPATGFSVGVSRLYSALVALGKIEGEGAMAPVVVLVMDRERLADYQRMVIALREAGIRAEMYLGTSGLKAQMKYADRRGAPCVIIQGDDELANGEVQIKDLIEGAKLSETIEEREEWRAARPAQFSVKTDELVSAVRDVLARHGAQ